MSIGEDSRHTADTQLTDTHTHRGEMGIKLSSLQACERRGGGEGRVCCVERQWCLWVQFGGGALVVVGMRAVGGYAIAACNRWLAFLVYAVLCSFRDQIPACMPALRGSKISGTTWKRQWVKEAQPSPAQPAPTAPKEPWHKVRCSDSLRCMLMCGTWLTLCYSGIISAMTRCQCFPELKGEQGRKRGPWPKKKKK